MKKIMTTIAMLVLSTSAFASGNSFEFAAGIHEGVTDNGKDCSLIITREVGNCSACKYKLIYQENGNDVYNYFPVLKTNYAIDNVIGDDGLYFSKQVSRKLGGYHNDSLVLEFDEEYNISSVELTKEGRLFGWDTVKRCNLAKPFQFSVQ